MSGTEDAGKEMSVILCCESDLLSEGGTLERWEHALSSNNTVGTVSDRNTRYVTRKDSLPKYWIKGNSSSRN
jgi:hypothetical protein